MNLQIDFLVFSLASNDVLKADDWRGAGKVLRYVCDTYLFPQPVDFVRVKPLPRYDVGWRCNLTQARFDWSVNEEQGHLVTLPGSWWLGLRPDTFKSALGTIEYPVKNITRLDVAYDYTSEESASDVAALWWLEHGRGKTRKSSLVASPKGSTFYIGSRHSDKYLRVYDKGLQLGKGNDTLRRCELEMKGRWLAANIQNLLEIPALCAEAMRDVLSLPDSDLGTQLEALTDGIIQPLLPGIRPKSDRVKWLLESVKPAFIKLAKENPDDALEVFEQIAVALAGVMKSGEYRTRQQRVDN